MQSLAKVFAQANAEAQTRAAAPGMEGQRNLVGVLQGLFGGPPSTQPFQRAGNSTPTFQMAGSLEPLSQLFQHLAREAGRK